MTLKQMERMLMIVLEIKFVPNLSSNCTLGEIFNGKGVTLPNIKENTPLVTLAE